ncbi:MAG: FtsL-like putative cell division protein [Crocinitomicaceae bacterium]|nr:FtsL-like putative cell division protein [Crocinitomicaceae bacterium]MDG1777684.1 FtsL-like putative cell division protein [Crocinitomicaceae bacterium]
MENDFLTKEQLEKKAAAEQAKRAKKRSKSAAAKKIKTSSFVQILNGDFLTKEFMIKNLSFIFFIMLLLLVVVGKGYYGKHLSKDVLNTQKKVNELTSDYFEAKATLEERTRRSELVEKLEHTGLKETINPTKVIKITKENTAIER